MQLQASELGAPGKIRISGRKMENNNETNKIWSLEIKVCWEIRKGLVKDKGRMETSFQKSTGTQGFHSFRMLITVFTLAFCSHIREAITGLIQIHSSH